MATALRKPGTMGILNAPPLMETAPVIARAETPATDDVKVPVDITTEMTWNGSTPRTISSIIRTFVSRAAVINVNEVFENNPVYGKLIRDSLDALFAKPQEGWQNEDVSLQEEERHKASNAYRRAKLVDILNSQKDKKRVVFVYNSFRAGEGSVYHPETERIFVRPSVDSNWKEITEDSYTRWTEEMTVKGELRARRLERHLEWSADNQETFRALRNVGAYMSMGGVCSGLGAFITAAPANQPYFPATAPLVFAVGAITLLAVGISTFILASDKIIWRESEIDTFY